MRTRVSPPHLPVPTREGTARLLTVHLHNPARERQRCEEKRAVHDVAAAAQLVPLQHTRAAHVRRPGLHQRLRHLPCDHCA